MWSNLITPVTRIHQGGRIGSGNRFSGETGSGREGLVELDGLAPLGRLDRGEAKAGVGLGSGGEHARTRAEAADLVDVEPVLAGCFRSLGEHAVAAGDDEAVEAADGVVEVEVGEDGQPERARRWIPW